MNMKKIATLFILVMSTILAIAQNGRIDLRHETKAEITKSEFTTLRALFSYGSIESQQVPTEKGVFSELAIEGTYAAGEIGSPELPASHQLLAVPFGATPRVSVINYTVTDYKLSDYGIGTILPHQPSVRKDQKPEDVKFVYNAESYQHRALAVAPEARVEVQGTLRGIRIGSLIVNPVSYNPASNTIRVFNDIEVEIDFEGADYAETERMLLNTYSPYFDIVYKQMFNYRQIMSVYDDHPDLMAYPVHMIVIAPQNYISTLQPWVNWKIQKGFDVNVYTTAQTGTSYSSIRSFVQNLYNTGVNQGKTPTFLILVGDTGQIPGTTGSSTQRVTDLYYGSTDGDQFPDMYYSRLSAENTTQLSNIINKILQYEQYTMPDPSYLNKVLLIAGEDDYWNSQVAQPTINYATTYYYNTAHGFTNVYAYLNSYNNCYNNLSTGVGFANYTAHGSETSWAGPYFSSSNVNSLTNTNKYFLAMGNCCQSGHYGASSPCLGEAMIRAANKGAFTYIGSCPNTLWYEDYYFGVGATNVFGSTPTLNNSATGVYDAVWMDETYNTVSSMVFLGNIAVCYANANGYQGSSSPLYYWQAYHVLGDGSIMPYRVNPTANNVSHASTISGSATSFTVHAQAGSYVGISQNNELKGAALVPASGSVNVPITALSSGQARIVVTKPQRQPYIQDINVSGGAPATYTVSISANPSNGGTVAFGNKGDRSEMTYDFEDGFPADWSTIDADGDGDTWMLGSEVMGSGYGHNASYDLIISKSYDNDNGALNPDNYFVSPQIALGGSITFWASAQDNAWAAEHFGVAVSTTSNTNANAFTTIQEWTMTAKGGGIPTGHTRDGGMREQGNWYQYTVDLSAYSGQGYVAIRHFNCTDFFYLNVDDITLSTGNSGSGPSDPIAATYTQGQSCTVTATPTTGYTFAGWKENGTTVSSNANYTFTVSGNRTLVATFTEQPLPQQYTITISPNPEEGGSVAFGSKTEKEGSWYYYDNGEYATTVGLNGQPFSWAIMIPAGTYTGNTVSKVALFDIAEWEGSLEIYNGGTTAPANLVGSMAVSCENESAFVELVFPTPIDIDPTQNVWVVANFVSGASYAAGAGEDTGDLNGRWVGINGSWYDLANAGLPGYNWLLRVYIEQSSTISATYAEGQSCTVTATPNSGYTFSGWKVNGTTVSNNASYTFNVTANRTLVANFTAMPQQYTVSVSASPTNGGTVSGGGTYTQGQSCTVTATPNSGYTFSGWKENGVTVSSNANYTFTVNANRTLVAQFTALPPEQFTISVSASPTNGGTVSGGGTYTQGQSCTVTATPNSGYTFSGWKENGVTVSSSASYTFTVTANRTLVANFTALPPEQFTINVSANPNEGGAVSGGGTYTQGQNCTVHAVANNGYSFTNWTENGVTVSTNASYSFVVTASRNLVANFTLQTFTVIASVDPAEGGTATVTGDNHYGSTVSVTVSLNDEYSFINWTENGVVVSESQTYAFVLTADRHLVANLLSTVGLDEQDVTVKLYPNPVGDKLTVSSDKAFNSVEVYNMMGVMVYSQKDCTDRIEIQTSQLPAGTYLIRLTTDHNTVIRRFVRE